MFRLAVGVNFHVESEKQLDVPLVNFFFFEMSCSSCKAGKY